MGHTVDGALTRTHPWAVIVGMDADHDGGHAGFSLGEGDRFWKILHSGDVPLPGEPGSVAVVVFFVVLRGSGLLDIVCVSRTFDSEGRTVTRSVQSKEGLPEAGIEDELRMVQGTFAAGIEAATNVPVDWKALDLAAVSDPGEQVSLIRRWGGVRVYDSSTFN